MATQLSIIVVIAWLSGLLALQVSGNLHVARHHQRESARLAQTSAQPISTRTNQSAKSWNGATYRLQRQSAWLLLMLPMII